MTGRYFAYGTCVISLLYYLYRLCWLLDYGLIVCHLPSFERHVCYVMTSMCWPLAAVTSQFVRHCVASFTLNFYATCLSLGVGWTCNFRLFLSCCSMQLAFTIDLMEVVYALVVSDYCISPYIKSELLVIAFDVVAMNRILFNPLSL